MILPYLSRLLFYADLNPHPSDMKKRLAKKRKSGDFKEEAFLLFLRTNEESPMDADLVSEIFVDKIENLDLLCAASFSKHEIYATIFCEKRFSKPTDDQKKVIVEFCRENITGITRVDASQNFDKNHVREQELDQIEKSVMD